MRSPVANEQNHFVQIQSEFPIPVKINPISWHVLLAYELQRTEAERSQLPRNYRTPSSLRSGSENKFLEIGWTNTSSIVSILFLHTSPVIRLDIRAFVWPPRTVPMLSWRKSSEVTGTTGLNFETSRLLIRLCSYDARFYAPNLRNADSLVDLYGIETTSPFIENEL